MVKTIQKDQLNNWLFILSNGLGILASILVIGNQVGLAKYFNLQYLDKFWFITISLSITIPSLIYILLKQTTEQSSLFTKLNYSRSKFYYNFKQRMLAGLVLSLLIGGGSYFYVSEYFVERKPVLLIGRFDGPNPQQHRVTSILSSRLRSDTLITNRFDIQVTNKLLDASTSREIALNIAEKKNADIFFWGWYGVSESVVISVNIELLGQYSELVREKSYEDLTIGFNNSFRGEPIVYSGSEFRNFKIQTELSNSFNNAIYIILGLYASRNSHWEMAYKYFTRAIETTPSDNKFSLAKTYGVRGGVLAQGFKNDTLALKDYNRALDFIYGEDQTPESQKEDFKKNSLENITLDEYTSHVFAQQLLNRGKIYRRLDSMQLAFRDFVHSLRFRPTPEAFMARAGFFLLEWNNPKAALSDLQKSISLDSTNVNTYYGLIIVYKNLSLYSKALEVSSKIIELSPNDPEAYHEKGNILEILGRQNQSRSYSNAAIMYYDKALKLDPTYIPAQYAKGRLYEMIEFPRLALKEYEKAVQIDPNHIESLIGMGFANFQLQNYKKALSIYNKVLSIDRNNYKALLVRNTLYTATNKFQLAISDLNRAAKIDTTARLYQQYGITYINEGDFRTAKSFFDKAVNFSESDHVTNSYNAKYYDLIDKNLN